MHATSVHQSNRALLGISTVNRVFLNSAHNLKTSNHPNLTCTSQTAARCAAQNVKSVAPCANPTITCGGLRDYSYTSQAIANFLWHDGTEPNALCTVNPIHPVHHHSEPNTWSATPPSLYSNHLARRYPRTPEGTFPK